jgi:hypothetical protein
MSATRLGTSLRTAKAKAGVFCPDGAARMAWRMFGRFYPLPNVRFAASCLQFSTVSR